MSPLALATLGTFAALLGLAALTSSCAGGDDRPRSDGGTVCAADSDCDDGVACTVDTCGVGGSCRFAPVDELCDAGETCSATSGCSTSSDCASDDHCDDGLACTLDSCGVDATCRHTPLNELCDGGEACDEAMGCVEGTGCGSDEDCDDELDCTLDSCGVDATCRHMPVDGRCTDGESCSPTIGCYTPMPCETAAECQDDDFCNGAEVCMPEFGCAPAPARRTCDDSDDCTVDSCDPDANMCVFACDTSRDECDCPTPSATCSGTFSLSPGPSYTCALGLVSYDLSTVTFSYDSGILTVRPASASFPDMTDSAPPACPEFVAEVTVSGACNETYRMSGSFSDDDNFTGTFEAEFEDEDPGSLHCATAGCTNQTVSVTGVRM